VSPHYNFRQLSARRKAALWFAALSFVLFVAGVLPLATAGWTDEKHFRMVLLLFGILLVVQLTGVLIALSSFK